MTTNATKVDIKANANKRNIDALVGEANRQRGESANLVKRVQALESTVAMQRQEIQQLKQQLQVLMARL